MKYFQRLFVPIATLLCFANHGFAEEYSYGLEALESWSGCNKSCSASGLRYSIDQINQMDTQLRKAGMTKNFKYINSDVWITDIKEDLFGGMDYTYADSVNVYALSSHGSYDTINSNQYYSPTMCNNPSDTLCDVNSSQMRFGEPTGSIYGSNGGKLQWLVLATCYSVHTEPFEQWSDAFSHGLDYLVGYRETSADSEYTDEVLADFADNVFRGTSKFKYGWFSAAEDWWIDDTASVITCAGTNTGTTSENLYNRLNNYRRTWTKRTNDGSVAYCAWAWHKG